MKVLLVGLIFLFLLIGYFIFENKNLEVSNYQLYQTKLPEELDGFRIALLTDLHDNQYGKENTKLLQKLERLNPDIVCLSGDMITASKLYKAQKGLDFILELAKRYPIYYALGNHEEKWKQFELSDRQATGYQDKLDRLSFEEFQRQLKKAGVFFLDNTSVTLQKGTATITITGLNLPLSFYYKKGKRPNLTKEELDEMIGTAAYGYQILLAHMPAYLKEYAAWGADLVLSGHVHGGVIILPKLGGVISPQYELFPMYDYGSFQEEDTRLILSRGLGTHTIPIRIFNRPELVGIELKKQKGSKQREKLAD